MGFFDKFIEGAKHAASWIVDHADKIVDVIGTITKVIAVVAVDPDEDVLNGNALTLLNDKFAQAEAKLTAANKSLCTKPLLDSKSTNTLPDDPIDIVGLWPDPALAGYGDASTEMSSDINKILSLHGLPTSLGTGGNAIDVGRSLAQQMMAKATALEGEFSTLISSPTGASTAGR